MYGNKYETNTEVLPYNTVHLLYEVILRCSVYVVTLANNAVNVAYLLTCFKQQVATTIEIGASKNNYCIAKDSLKALCFDYSKITSSCY